MSTVDVGAIRITALSDGESNLPTLFYPGLEFARHPDLLAGDGMYHIPTTCFLIQGPDFTVLVDAGIGPAPIPFPPELVAPSGLAAPPRFIAEGGRLPEGLSALGVKSSDVETLFLTHLHPDHVGWVAPGQTLTFPDAEVVYGAADWPLVEAMPADDPGRRGLETARDAHVLRAITDSEVAIAPGVTAVHSPGHTPGHYGVRVESGGRCVLLTGDAIQHPLQLNDRSIRFLSDANPQRALDSRERLLTTAAATGMLIGANHLPGSAFRRITATSPRSWQQI